MADGLPADLFRVLERYVANPVLRIVLRSPLHGLASGALVLLSYEGRRSGERFRTPVAFERDGDDIVVTTFRDEAVWWRNFQEGHPARLWIEGEPVPVSGRAITDENDVAEWLATLADRDARIVSLFDVPDDAGPSDLDAVAADLVVVRFTPT